MNDINVILEELENNLYEIQKTSGNYSPTANNVLDSILLKYPKIKGLNQDMLDCFKAIIIKHLKNLTSKSMNIKTMFANILQDISKDCK